MRSLGVVVSGSLLVVAFVAFGAIAVFTPVGQWVDVHLYGLTVRHTPGVLAQGADRLAREVLLVGGPAVAALLGLVALVRGRWRNVLGAALVGVVVPAVWALRGALPRPDFGVGAYPYNTFPSTHVAIVAVSCWAIWLCWPTGRRSWVPWTLVGIVVLALFGNVANHAHMPADGLGSLLLTGGVGLLACTLVGLDPLSPTTGAKRQPESEPVGVITR